MKKKTNRKPETTSKLVPRILALVICISIIVLINLSLTPYFSILENHIILYTILSVILFSVNFIRHYIVKYLSDKPYYRLMIWVLISFLIMFETCFFAFRGIHILIIGIVLAMFHAGFGRLAPSLFRNFI